MEGIIKGNIRGVNREGGTERGDEIKVKLLHGNTEGGKRMIWCGLRMKMRDKETEVETRATTATTRQLHKVSCLNNPKNILT